MKNAFGKQHRHTHCIWLEELCYLPVQCKMICHHKEVCVLATLFYLNGKEAFSTVLG